MFAHSRVLNTREGEGAFINFWQIFPPLILSRPLCLLIFTCQKRKPYLTEKNKNFQCNQAGFKKFVRILLVNPVWTSGEFLFPTFDTFGEKLPSRVLNLRKISHPQKASHIRLVLCGLCISSYRYTI